MKIKINLLILFFSIKVFSESNVYIAMIENNTYDSDYIHNSRFQDSGTFLLSANSVKDNLDFSALRENKNFQLSCAQLTNPDIYLKVVAGMASGDCGDPDIMPKYLEIWTGGPNPPSSEKQYVRFCVTDKEIHRGFIGIRILANGEPRLFNVYGINFLDSDLVVDHHEDSSKRNN